MITQSSAELAPGNSPFEKNVRALEVWLTRQMLANISLTKVFSEFSHKIDQTLFPLLRSHVVLGQMHPFIDHVDHTWNREGDLNTNSRPRSFTEPERWVQSPLYPMLKEFTPEIRYDLSRPEVVEKFPVFLDFEAAGGKEYIAFLISFGDHNSARKLQDGVILTWLTDQKGGFQEYEVVALRHLVSQFAVVARIFKREQALNDILGTYLGPLAARQVLNGKNQRGDGDIMSAVIWVCDLRGSCTLADGMEMSAYLTLLNQFFESMAEAVMAEGGEVLKFMGDGFLAIFPTGEDAVIADAATRAIAAARNGTIALANHPSDAAKLKFGIGIHHGDVMFGNIGAPERLDFSVIGPAVNMASRLQDLTKSLDVSLLVSAPVAAQAPGPWRRFPPQSVTGLKDPIEVLAPA